MTVQRTVIIERVKADPPLTTGQMRVTHLLEEGLSPHQIAERLGISYHTVNWYIREAARAIPGDFPSTTRLIAWYRGAPLYVLESLASTQSRQLRAALDARYGNGKPL